MKQRLEPVVVHDPAAAADLRRDAVGALLDPAGRFGTDRGTAANPFHDGVQVCQDVRVDAGANLELIGTIHNDGMIDVDGQKTDLVIDGSVTLDGGGVITLDNAAHLADQIVGVSDTEEYSTLYNVDNTIEGAGNVGTGNGNLSLVNERCGAIDANLCGQTLTLDTGNSIANWGNSKQRTAVSCWCKTA